MSAPMPPAFLGQSSRMNALETNRYTEAWRSFGATVPCGLLVAADLADEITRAVDAPTIGIGASPQCDGQFLVTDDMLGLFDWTPKFVRRYGNLRETISQAVQGYARDVRSGDFPGTAELYTLKIG